MANDKEKNYKSFSAEVKTKACEDYSSGLYTIRAICEKYGLCYDEKRDYSICLTRWMNQYKLAGRNAFSSVKRLKRYSAETKKNAVMDYLSGNYSLSDLVIKYDISCKEVLGKWVRLYKNGIELNDSRNECSDEPKTNQYNKYSAEVKINACKDFLSKLYTIREICEKYGIYFYEKNNDSPRLRKWVRQFEKLGEAAFNTKKRVKNEYSDEIKANVIKDYLTGNYSLLQISLNHNLSRETVRSWINNYQSQLNQGKGSIGNNNVGQYSPEIKVKACEDYLSGSYTMLEVCEKYGIKFNERKKESRLLLKWIAIYKKDGSPAFYRQKFYSAETKIKACEDYLSGSYTMLEVCEKYGLTIDKTRKKSLALLVWIAKYKKDGEAAFSKQRKFYSAELKRNAVSDYLSGRYFLSEIMSKYDIAERSVLQDWIRCYNIGKEFNDSRPVRSSKIYMEKQIRKTTFGERKDIVNYCIRHDHNYSRTAELYEISYKQVYNWVKKYESKGEAGLIDNRGHHKTDEEVDELQRLTRENRRLHQKLKEKDMVVELLKKVKEFERR